jgi:TonB family protein
MNTALVTTLSLLAALATLPTNARADACHPRIIQDDTTFPMRSELRGQKGTVFLEVQVDDQGRASSVNVVDSSGHRLLDRAAEQSALDRWQFDISGCERKDLPVTHRIAVEYRNEEY